MWRTFEKKTKAKRAKIVSISAGDRGKEVFGIDMALTKPVKLVDIQNLVSDSAGM